MRVVIVDDRVLVREALVHVIDQQDDLEVVGQASSGKAAGELAEALRPDVLVLDRQLPDVSVVEAAAHVRDVSPQTRVIALCLDRNSHGAQRLEKAGIHVFAAKSNSIDRLLEIIRGR